MNNIQPTKNGAVAEAAAPINVPDTVQYDSLATNPLDISPEVFAAGLKRRGENRKALLQWVQKSLKEGIDFGSIHVVSKKKCPAQGKCKNRAHYSKPSLFKPGAEKICGMLGLTPTFPTLSEYERMTLEGRQIKTVLIRCEMVSGTGQVIAEGVGARNVDSDYGDLNKSLKMALKSAQIDATLRCGGLSEIFTQDIEDMKPSDMEDIPDEAPPEFSRDFRITFGLYGINGKETAEQDMKVGTRLRDIPGTSLTWLKENANEQYIREFAQRELQEREKKTTRAKNPDTITESQLKRLWIEARQYYGDKEADGELHLAIQKKYGAESVKTLTKSQAKHIIDGLAKANEKRASAANPGHKTQEDLIDLALEKWQCSKSSAVEFLNTKANKLFRVKTIDSLNPIQIEAMSVEMKKWEAPF